MVSAGLVGIWIDREGVAHGVRRGADGTSTVFTEAFQPYAWAREPAETVGIGDRALAGEGSYAHRWTFAALADYHEALRDRERPLDAIRPLEHQWLLARRERLFEGLTFPELRRCQLKIAVEAGDPGEAPDPARSGDRVVAIALQSNDGQAARILQLEERTDPAERALLKAFGEMIVELDPDVIEGHGIYNFDLDYLVKRSRRFRVARRWGRFSAEVTTRKGRLRVAERWIDYMRCDFPGRAVFDSQLAVQLFDVSSRDMTGYDLETAADYFGLAGGAGEAEGPVERLTEELGQIAGLAGQLLPTYVAQAQSFPMLLQEACLRGTGSKVDLLLLEQYFHADHALPVGSEVATFAGGFTKSYGTGVFRNVLHFDVASLYPSLLLQIGRNPANDTLGAFIPLLGKLRTYRLEYKQKAREEADHRLRQEYQARQASFKILINSFYGYLGFPGARFADGELASEVTQRGRELLQRLIAWFEEQGHAVLEADTDGIYVAAPEYYENPEALLREAQTILPAGIDLELDGRYPAMFCYKAKNYALFDGESITVRGSALRSRGIEPFLSQLTDHLIRYLLGVEESSPEILLHRMAVQIEEGDLSVGQLAKGEFLSMSPAAYELKMAQGGKPRRASLEVALRMDPRPRMGERVNYYIGPKEKGQTADWQRAVPLDHFDAFERPYDPKYYLRKLRDWQKRYGVFFEG